MWLLQRVVCISVFAVVKLAELIDRIHSIGPCYCSDCSATKNAAAKILPAVAIVTEIAGNHMYDIVMLLLQLHYLYTSTQYVTVNNIQIEPPFVVILSWVM